MAILPAWVCLKQRATLRFHVSLEMVEAFSALTGDRSALHVSEEFARRSLYRKPIVHGMLPLAFLAVVENLAIAGRSARLTSIEAQFVAPVYLEEALELSVEPAAHQESENEIVVEFQILKRTSRTVVTTGTFKVLYEDKSSAKENSGDISSSGSSSLMMGPLTANNLQLDELSAGMSGGFDFQVGREALHDLIAILMVGVEGQGRSPSADFITSFLPNQLAIVLFSTFVGMRIPGKSATFLSFSAKLDEGIKCERPYHLLGTVSHVSRSTRILKSVITIQPKDGPDGAIPIHGRITTLVNRPVKGMPTAKELKMSALDFGLRDKVVLVTGASRGIGETTAKLFAAFGARVIVNYHHGKEDAERIVREILAEGGEAIAFRADVTQKRQVEEMVDTGSAQYGSIHVLVNNAVQNYRPVPFGSLTWDEIQADLDVIVRGAFNCCKAVTPLMLTQGGGKIVNVSSLAVEDPPPDQMKYIVAKSALVGLTRSLSMDLASKNIQVNMVVPSFVETDLVSHIQEGFRNKIAKDTPMGRHATAVDVAQAIVFLSSRLSSYTTGQKLMVTGGKPPYL